MFPGEGIHGWLLGGEQGLRDQRVSYVVEIKKFLPNETLRSWATSDDILLRVVCGWEGFVTRSHTQQSHRESGTFP